MIFRTLKTFKEMHINRFYVSIYSVYLDFWMVSGLCW